MIVKHGEYIPGTNRTSVEYRAWCAMKNRCYNPAYENFDRYGGRGIKVCAEWIDDPAAFIRYVGRRPSPKHTIDRIDCDRGYEPGNVRWSTKLVQGRNRSSVKLTLFDARFIRHWRSRGYSGVKIARQFGVSQQVVCDIVKRRTWVEEKE